MEPLAYSTSIAELNKLSFEDYQLWLDNAFKLNQQSSLFYFIHISTFLEKFSNKLGISRFAYVEKQFFYALELKLLDWAERLLNNMMEIFGPKEPKIVRMQADFIQCKQTKNDDPESSSPLEESLEIYRKLIKENQNDRASLKSYLTLIKTTVSMENIRTYINYLNEYVKVFMDDVEVWNELAELYITTLNYNKAIFCLEEVLLHFPNNYLVYIKIGDLLNSFNDSESAKQALKYYCKSIIIRPTPRAFWGIVYIVNTLVKYKEKVDGKLISCLKIATENLKHSYPRSLLDDLIPSIS